LLIDRFKRKPERRPIARPVHRATAIHYLRQSIYYLRQSVRQLHP